MVGLGLIALVLSAGDVWPTLPGTDAGTRPAAKVAPPGSAVPDGTRALPVNVWADEDLEVDTLRTLATRPGVTLWLSTRTNSLRESTLDTLAKAKHAYVAVKPPFTAALRAQLARVSHVGLWVELNAASVEGIGSVLGNRPLAVTLRGELARAQVELLSRTRPRVVHWWPTQPPDVLALAQARQLPGRVWLRWPEQAPEPSGCPPNLGVTLALRLKVGAQPDLTCARQAIFEVATFFPAGELVALARLAPTAEVSFEVGADADRARGVSRLLEQAGWR